MKNLIFIAIILFAASCGSKEYKATGSIERLDPALDNIISPNAKVEIIAEGFDWSEGPLWVESQNMLLFSDVPKNIVYQWTEEKGADIYLRHSGYTDTIPRGGEMGSNGLLLDKDGNLILCQHGDRRLATMIAPLNNPKPEFKTIASGLEGKGRFNSPNDAALVNGIYYMTDPFYGLEKRTEDPKKEIPFQGVYRIATDGNVQVLVDSITCPNGIAMFPDGRHLLVANSDPQKAKWYLYELSEPDDAGSVTVNSGKVFYDATSLIPTVKGLPDGLKIDSHGNVFASGPGGVWIFNQDGKVLGKINLDERCSNTALSKDEKTLYVSNDMQVLRIRLR